MTERGQVKWGTTPIAFEIRRSARRATVSLRIDDGRLVVTAPAGVATSRLGAVVRQKASWVVARLRRAAEAGAAPSAREFVTGEAVLYRGRQYRLRVVEAAEGAPARLRSGWYEVTVPTGLGDGARRAEVRRRLVLALRARAAVVLSERLDALCAQMRQAPPVLRVRAQKARWGSCDADGVLRINWRVVQCPDALIDYVLVHELTHREHPVHGTAFWRAVGRRMPDYEARRERLRTLGPRLVW